jgi:ABC-type sugar transport system ATPase subunit
VNFEVQPNEMAAFVGLSGAGKTTIINLLSRFYEPTGGKVTIDGIDIRDVTLASLRSQIGLVTQDIILFNDSVRNNIAYGLKVCRKKRSSRLPGPPNATTSSWNFPERTIAPSAKREFSSQAARDNAWRSPGLFSRIRPS